jgi:hypothetical protein
MRPARPLHHRPQTIDQRRRGALECNQPGVQAAHSAGELISLIDEVVSPHLAQLGVAHRNFDLRFNRCPNTGSENAGPVGAKHLRSPVTGEDEVACSSDPRSISAPCSFTITVCVVSDMNRLLESWNAGGLIWVIFWRV